MVVVVMVDLRKRRSKRQMSPTRTSRKVEGEKRNTVKWKFKRK